jgi:hypothetical protein
MSWFVFLFGTLLLAQTSILYSESMWSLEIGTGSAYSFPTTLKIQQDNQPEIRVDAEYETRPWEDSPYYSWRISRWNDGGAWELEFVHMKLYLTNNPTEVQHFEVTHGYNLLYVNKAWRIKSFDIRIGGGIVIGHPESTVRNLTLNDKTDLSGISGQVAVNRRVYFSKRFFINPEGKLTFSTASVPIANGDASVPNIALQGLISIGFDL